MSVKLSPIPRKQFTDVNGDPLNGGKLFYYLSGTSTKATTYSNSAGTVPNSNPIILDGSGRSPVAIYFTDGVAYEEVLAPSTDTDPPVSFIYSESDLVGAGASIASADEWQASGYVPTYISENSFSVPGDVTLVLNAGRRLKTTDSGGVNYSKIVTSSFAAGITTVTVLVDGGLSLDSGLSSVSYGLLSATNPSIPEILIQQIRNPIVNGGMRIAQNGGSFAAAVNLAYDLDGWTNENTSAAVFTIARLQSGLGAGNPSIYQRTVTVTTADAAIAAGDYVAQRNAIEGYDTTALIARTFTIGFWVRSSVVGIHCVSIYDGTKSYVSEYTINVADTAEFKTVTIFGGLQTAASFTNAAGIYVFFANANGATYQTTKGAWNVGFFTGTSSQVNDMGTIGNVFSLSDVFICLGTAALPNRLNYPDELARCQRYYWKGLPLNRMTSTAVGVSSSDTVTCHFPVTMRAVPTLAKDFTGATLVNVADSNVSDPTVHGCRLFTTSTAAGTVSQIFAAANYIEALARL
ncbi:MAG: hypothetical protein WC465_04850 [Patescibacteria group bacterium]